MPIKKILPPERTQFGMPLKAYEFENGCRSYIYGDCLPKNDKEREERERSIARVCEEIILNKIK